MAANRINVVTTMHAVQYTGTNSAEILALNPGFTVNNSSVNGAGVWSFQSPPDSNSFVANPTNWIVFGQGYVFYVWTISDFNLQYDCNITCVDFNSTVSPAVTTAINTAVSGLPSGTMVRAQGVAPVPGLLLGASANVDVTIRPTMPNTSFTPYASKFAGISLVDLVINSTTIINTSTVRVNVSNTGLVTLAGASVMVHAVA